MGGDGMGFFIKGKWGGLMLKQKIMSHKIWVKYSKTEHEINTEPLSNFFFSKKKNFFKEIVFTIYTTPAPF